MLPPFRSAYSQKNCFTSQMGERFPWVNPQSQRKTHNFSLLSSVGHIFLSLSSMLSAVPPAKINGGSLNSNFCIFRLSPVSPASFCHIYLFHKHYHERTVMFQSYFENCSRVSVDLLASVLEGVYTSLWFNTSVGFSFCSI